jgi:histidyl-tRNA synthetase
MGVERLLALWRESGEAEYAAERQVPDVYVVHQGERAQRMAFRAAETLRDIGFDVLLHCGGGSFKSQMKKADGSGATLALVIGDDEAAAEEVGIKTLRGGGQQCRAPFSALAETVADTLYGSEAQGAEKDGSI